MDTKEIYTALSAEFPQNAYNTDKSRGFPLIGIRGAFVIERLNNVFGLLGMGWRYSHSPFVEHGKEIVTEVALQYRVTDKGTKPFVWDPMQETFAPLQDASSVWSEPIYGVGGNAKGSGSVPVSDAQKSAISNALGKAASRMGVGIDAYKGNLATSDGEIVLKSDSGATPADESNLIKLLMKKMLLEAPDTYDAIAKENELAAAHRKGLVAQIKTAIKTAGLSEFVSNSLQAIVGDKKVKSIENLSARQLLLLNNVAKTISAGEVTWKQALEITGSLGEKTWEVALAEFIAASEKNEEDGS